MVNSKCKISIVGALDQESDLDVASKDCERIILDFEKCSHITSAGLGKVNKFLDDVGGDVKVHYQNCHHMVLRVLNLMAGAIRKNVTIDSLYLPYHCDACSSQVEYLAKNGTDFSPPSKTPEIKENLICQNCGEKMFFSVEPERYFDFLERMAK